ncbi:MAG: hypothetical protein MUP66_02900 [Candidatus Nanohaloarchaeota archaeon QJJ-5]|nr:hypothetical protein [Candidatus Nanohaloarchaeota archaeon QJJ-5]
MQYLISYDMNGPLTRTDTSELIPHEGVKDAFDRLPYEDADIEIVINSGYDIETLRHFRDDVLEQDDIHLIGEMGSVYDHDGDLEQVFPDEPEQDMIDLKRRLYQEAAAQKRKLHEQGNYSSTVGCTRIEAEGSPTDPRGEVYKHHAFDPAVETEDIYTALPDDRFTYDGDHITFDPTDDTAIKALSDTLRYEYTFTGVRFHETEEGIGFYRDTEDAPITRDQAHGFMEQVLDETDWQYQHNPDWGTDYMKDLELSKQHGATQLATALFDADPQIIHVGDKPGDVMNGDASFYAIEGSEAQQYCERYDISHTVVSDGVEFTDHVLALTKADE